MEWSIQCGGKKPKRDPHLHFKHGLQCRIKSRPGFTIVMALIPYSIPISRQSSNWMKSCHWNCQRYLWVCSGKWVLPRTFIRTSYTLIASFRHGSARNPCLGRSNGHNFASFCPFFFIFGPILRLGVVYPLRRENKPQKGSTSPLQTRPTVPH